MQSKKFFLEKVKWVLFSNLLTNGDRAVYMLWEEGLSLLPFACKLLGKSICACPHELICTVLLLLLLLLGEVCIPFYRCIIGIALLQEVSDLQSL